MALFIPGTSYLYESGLDNLVQHARGNGVITGCGVAAHAVPDLGVRVAAGTIQYDGALVTVAQTDLVVGANGTGNSRWDLISVTSAGVPAITQGVAAATPKPPALPANSLALALVAIAPAAVNVQNANIENRRLISTIGQGVVAGTLANRPTATMQNGMTYFATDDQGGTLYRSNGATWAQLAMNTAPTTVTTPNLIGNADYARRTTVQLALTEVFADLGAWAANLGVLGTVAANVLTAGSTGAWRAVWQGPTSMYRDGRWTASAKFTDIGAASYIAVEKYAASTDVVRAAWSNGVFYLIKKIAGVDTVVSSIAQAATLNNWYYLELECQATTYIAKLWSQGAANVYKNAATLLQTIQGTIADASVTAGGLALFSQNTVASQWGGMSTGGPNTSVFVEAPLPEGWTFAFDGVIGGQAVGLDEAADAGPIGRQAAMRIYIPPAAAARRLIAQQIGQDGAFAPSTTYISSAYVKTSGSTSNALLLFRIFEATSAGGLGTSHDVADAGQTSWTRVPGTAWTNGATTRRFVMWCYFNPGLVGGQGGTFWLGLPQLEQGGAVTAWRNAPQDYAPLTIIKSRGTTANATSVSYAEIDGRDLAGNYYMPADGRMEIKASVYQYNSGIGNRQDFDFTIDGVAVDLGAVPALFSATAAGATTGFTVTGTWVAPLAMGWHRVALRWKTTGGTATLDGGIGATFTVTMSFGK